jgi:diguanylate cyclase (GGDEF)-like protein
LELLNKVTANIIAFVFLAIVLHVARLRLDARDRFNKLFFISCTLVLVALTLETVSGIVSGLPYVCADCVLKGLYAFLFVLPPLLAYFWMLFIRVLTGDDSKEIGVIRPAYGIPAMAAVALSCLSAFWGVIFVVDGNGYGRGPLFWLEVLTTNGYLFFCVYLLIRRRERLLREEFMVLILICMLPIIGGLLQVFLHGTFWMWSTTAGSLIVLYVYLQERMIQVDSLTGAWTRQSLAQHLNQMAGKCAEEPMGILFLDIDDFKSINDRFGHAEGDAALKTFAAIVQAQLRKGDAFARLGGDEFSILASVGGEDGLKAIERKIHAALEDYNRESGKPYRLSCSIGSELYGAVCNLDAALIDVDRLMYEQKRGKKG